MSSRPLVTNYKLDSQIFPGYWHKLGLLLLVGVVTIYPLLASDYWLFIANRAFITIVGAAGLMILTGFAGQISLGHAAFFAIGAYSTAVLATQLFLPFWLLMPAAGIIAALVGLSISPFAFRLKGIYLSIVTLALIYIVKHILTSLPQWTKVPGGIAAPMFSWFPSEIERTGPGGFTLPLELDAVTLQFEHKLYFLFLLVAVYAVYLCKNLQRSNLGRAMMAVRDRDFAASAMGISPNKVKALAMTLSSFWAGIAGSMLAFNQQFITLDPPFNLIFSVEYIAIIVIGGLGTVFGIVAGALVYTYVSPLAQQVGSLIPYINQLTSSEQSTLLFSVVVGLILIYEPLGIFGIWLNVRRYFSSWPFKR